MLRSKRIFLALFCLALWRSPSRAGELILQNNLACYGDNTEFFEPFRLRETILGQRLESFLSAETGAHSVLRAGFSSDHRSAEDASTDVLPILSLIYRTSGGEAVFGTLLPLHRHGLLEPLEATTLELTRPVEYGLQWIQRDGPVQADLFLNWQRLLTEASREIFDYGGSSSLPLAPWAALGAQVHCYHVGGVEYGGVVRNNFAGGLGIHLGSRLPLLGQSSLEAYGLASNDTARPGYPGPINGSGFYAKGAVSPFANWTFFGIAWVGRDFMSEEGDSNYNSWGYDGVYYLSDRHYEEAGLRYSVTLDQGVDFDFELRSHWIEDAWAHSFRITASAPFDVDIDVTKKPKQGQREDAKTQRKDEDGEPIPQ